jgi:hypothetical protein
MKSLRFFAPVVVIVAACGYSSPAASPPPPVSVTANRVITEPEVRRILTALAHDSMEGRRTGTPGANRAAAFIAAEMKAIGLTPAGDSAYFQRVPFAAGGRRGVTLLDSFAELDTVAVANRRISYNVIGIMRGTDPALRDQVVVIGAHYDHMGIGTPVNGDSVFNGADDDASGVTAVLEIARAIAAGAPPKRTMVFMSTVGEEQGILGTRWYVQHPVFPISQMVADMEIEMIGRPDSLAGGPGKAWLTGYNRSTMGDLLKGANVPIVPDPYPQMNFFERSDNIIFARMGIPAHTLSSYNLHRDYHTVADDVDKVDFAHMTAVIRAAATAARLLADGPAPEWKEGGRPAPRN